jgi:hypothetical protein
MIPVNRAGASRSTLSTAKRGDAERRVSGCDHWPSFATKAIGGPSRKGQVHVVAVAMGRHPKPFMERKLIR